MRSPGGRRVISRAQPLARNGCIDALRVPASAKRQRHQLIALHIRRECIMRMRALRKNEHTHARTHTITRPPARWSVVYVYGYARTCLCGRELPELPQECATRYGHLCSQVPCRVCECIAKNVRVGFQCTHRLVHVARSCRLI